MSAPGIAAIVEWLVDGARSTRLPHETLAELCERLVAADLPLWRVGVFVRTLHPEIMGRRVLWRAGEGASVVDTGFQRMADEDFLHSPVVHVIGAGTTLRRRLADPDCPIDFPILAEFRAEGITDYLITPLVFIDGSVHVATWSTRQDGGFTDSQIANIGRVVAPLARAAEVRTLRRNAENILDAYVGRQAGERILAGRIRRGDSEAIHAAIWLSDMRGFSALADRLPPQMLLDLLNRYFDCQVPAILERGGEVLKFMGDGLLAIFPVGADGTDARSVCAAALAAARDARARLAAAEPAGALPAGERLRFGLALHLGEVLYGNVGGGNRLDFTCIGPAVNRASRIEALTRELGRTVLASREFAEHCPGELVPVGDYALRGFGAKQPVFGLRDEEAGS